MLSLVTNSPIPFKRVLTYSLILEVGVLVMRLAILTSGGDSPGMNAALRSIVRVAKYKGWSVVGVRRGYEGLIQADFEEMTARSVSNIIQHGGTILQTSRSKEFMQHEGQAKAAHALKEAHINGLIVIGGNGSFRGAVALSKLWDGQIVGIPGTIDNDLYGTDLTIGFDTAVNTAIDALDRIRDTAEAHERLFVVEVMGRHAGYIALQAGIAGGAEEVLVPEIDMPLQEVYDRLAAGKLRGKSSFILVVAEGNTHGGAVEVAAMLTNRWGIDCRVVILGHIQRGGVPTAIDRVLATKLGGFAVDCIEAGKHLVMVGDVKNELVTTPLEETWLHHKPLDTYLLKISRMLES